MSSMKTGRAALILTGIAALALPQAATAASPAATAAPTAKQSSARDAGQLAEHLLDQDLTWETCEFPGQAASLKERLNAIPGTACATVEVPRDWNDPVWRTRPGLSPRAGRPARGSPRSPPGRGCRCCRRRPR